MRAHPQRPFDLLLLELRDTVDLHVAHERPLLHAEGHVDVVALGRGHVGVDLVEEAHAVDRADVAVERVLVERRPGLGAEMDADRVLLDAEVARDPHLADAGLALGLRRGLRRGEQQHGEHPRRAAHPRAHSAPPLRVPRHATDAPGSASLSRPSAR